MYPDIPDGLALLNGIAVCFLPLNEKTIKKMQEELAVIRRQESADESEA